MENKSKSELIRLALAERGPSTAAELAEGIDVEVNLVGALLAWDVNHGRIVRGWRGNRRIFGLPGSIDNVSPLVIQPVKSRAHRTLAPKPRASRQNHGPDVLQMPDVAPGDNFRTLSEKARQCEQVNNFTDAAPLWLIAADFAAKEVNQLWCRSRSDFCVRGWKYPEVIQ